uniref:RNA helicase n=1 Tax=viral metagenome TaxID=1070528 RepID=A0A6C0I8F7_9ZZZZ
MSLNEENKNELVINVEEIDKFTANEIPVNGINVNEDTENPDYSFTSWDNLEINTDLLRGIYSYGFEQPSPIQMKAIKPIMLKKDLIAQAQSGTGKTATFSIGVLHRISVKDNYTQALIMSPTHELTTQISGVISGLGNMIEGLRVKTIVGGSSIDEDVADMRKNVPHIIVGTPGRVFDMIRRRHINAKKLKIMVLDEADEMLSTGFKEQIYNIFQYLNSDVQIALFSATIPNDMIPLTEKFMRNPVRISVKIEQLTLEGIKQYYVALDDDMQKYDTLKDIYHKMSFNQCIIYCNSVRRVQDLYDAMRQDNFPVCCIHSNMDKHERTQAFKDFRLGSSRVLISSNVTARGIDIQQVSVVINFDIPRSVHTYLHRIGRSGRWGRKGTGINFVTRRDIYNMRSIEDFYHCQINELTEGALI